MSLFDHSNKIDFLLILIKVTCSLKPKKRIPDDFELQLIIDNNQIENVSKQKLLGFLRAILCNHLNFYIGPWHAYSPISLKLSYLGHLNTKLISQHSFGPISYPLPWKRQMNILAKSVSKIT